MSKIKIFALGGLNENGKNMYVVDVDNNLFVLESLDSNSIELLLLGLKSVI